MTDTNQVSEDDVRRQINKIFDETRIDYEGVYEPRAEELLIDLIRTEKLKLLDRLEAQFIEEVVVIFGETEFKKQVPLSAIEAERNKLEAEL